MLHADNEDYEDYEDYDGNLHPYTLYGCSLKGGAGC